MIEKIRDLDSVRPLGPKRFEQVTRSCRRSNNQCASDGYAPYRNGNRRLPRSLDCERHQRSEVAAAALAQNVPDLPRCRTALAGSGSCPTSLENNAERLSCNRSDAVEVAGVTGFRRSLSVAEGECRVSGIYRRAIMSPKMRSRNWRALASQKACCRSFARDLRQAQAGANISDE